METRVDGQRLEQLLAQRGVGQERGRRPVGDHRGRLVLAEHAVEHRARTLERVEQATAGGADAGDERIDGVRGRHVLEALGVHHPVERVGR